jgi:hypothetical protein
VLRISRSRRKRQVEVAECRREKSVEAAAAAARSENWRKRKRRKKEENFADSIPVVVCTTVQGENIRTIEFLTRHLAYIIRSS